MTRRGASKASVVVCLGLALVLVFFCGLMWPLELVFWLTIGWLPFLGRVFSQIRPDWYSVATCAAALAMFTIGLHLFLRWLCSATRRSPNTEAVEFASQRAIGDWQFRWTAAIVGIIVLMFAAGISAVGVSHQITWLATSDKPLLSPNLVREAAQRASSTNNLRNIAIALESYANAQGSYPAGATISSDGRALHSWQTVILPYIDQQQLYKTIDLQTPWNDPSHRSQFAKQIKLYLMPQRDLPVRDGNGYALSHYAANQHLIGGSSRHKHDLPDGSSNTILCGEAAGNYKPWGNPTNWRDPADGINKSRDGFGAHWNSHGAAFAFADGRVQFISDKTDPKVLRALATPAGGEPIPADY